MSSAINSSIADSSPAVPRRNSSSITSFGSAATTEYCALWSSRAQKRDADHVRGGAAPTIRLGGLPRNGDSQPDRSAPWIESGAVREPDSSRGNTWLTSRLALPSRTTSSKTARSRRPKASRSTASSPARSCTTRPTRTTRASGPSKRPSSSTGTRTGTRSASGTCRSPSGSSAASSTCRTTASTATWRPAGATRSRTTGRASPATRARSPMPTCWPRCRSSPTR